jgi:hypothetical protein
MKSYKDEISDGTPEDLVTNAITQLNELGDELRQWASSMEGTNLENSEKYTELCEAADTLEGLEFSPEDDWPHPDARVTYHYRTPRRKKRSPSRQVRLENANAQINAVIGFYTNLDDDLEDIISSLEELVHDIDIPTQYS